MTAQPTLQETTLLPLTGREEYLAAFKTRLASKARGKPIMISGPAGIGKTALLRAFEKIAQDCGWPILADTASPGLNQRISKHLPLIYQTLTGGQRPPENQSLSQALSLLAQQLHTREQGLLITIDGVNKQAAQHLQELLGASMLTTVQGLPLQLVLAGRSPGIRDFLALQPQSLRKNMEKLDLSSLTRSQTEQALRRAYEACPKSAGRRYSLPDETLVRAARATHGYPLMVHLVSEGMRRHALTQDPSEEQLNSELAAAQERLGTLVLEPLLAKLSGGDRAFLLAMAEDDGPSRMNSIAARLGKTPQYAGVYRNRLVEAGIIRSASYGKVTFAIPHLRQYLRAHTEVEDSFSTF